MEKEISAGQLPYMYLGVHYIPAIAIVDECQATFAACGNA